MPFTSIPMPDATTDETVGAIATGGVGPTCATGTKSFGFVAGGKMLAGLLFRSIPETGGAVVTTFASGAGLEGSGLAMMLRIGRRSDFGAVRRFAG